MVYHVRRRHTLACLFCNLIVNLDMICVYVTLYVYCKIDELWSVLLCVNEKW